VARFDLVLVPGPKIRDRLMSLGLIRDGGYAMVGYPKFDAVGANEAERPPLFPNDNPTVLYNPHFEPRLSSWYDMGIDVLDYFAGTPEYNLVFAPHVMLFRRRLHTSIERFTVRLRHSLPERFLMRENIHVDLGSNRCIDMTYTLGADVYLGDVSSQVYEFLLHPRPCIFLNAHQAQWQGDPDYLHWNCGPVLQNVEALDETLARATEDRARYRPVQESLFAQTIDTCEIPSSRRAALAIAEHLSR
jgi:CDP-glycerol glycerophosphotransferase (TagB/SpsB family)